MLCLGCACWAVFSAFSWLQQQVTRLYSHRLFLAFCCRLQSTIAAGSSAVAVASGPGAAGSSALAVASGVTSAGTVLFDDADKTGAGPKLLFFGLGGGGGHVQRRFNNSSWISSPLANWMTPALASFIECH